MPTDGKKIKRQTARHTGRYVSNESQNAFGHWPEPSDFGDRILFVNAQGVVGGNDDYWPVEYARQHHQWRPVAAAYSFLAEFANSISDVKLKKNITPIQSGDGVIDLLNPVHFNWNSSSKRDTNILESGFIAQEVEQILPCAVHEIDNPQIGAKTKILDYHKIIPHLVKYTKDLSAKVSDLEARLAALESQISNPS